MDFINLNISLTELSDREGLSVRSSNLCEGNSLVDLHTILEYYWSNGNFLELRNCGVKSNIELIQLCQKYELYNQKPTQIEPEIPIEPIKKHIQNLTIRQKKILNNIIDTLLNELSVRSVNALNIFSQNNLSISGLEEIIIEPNFDFYEFKNIGKKSVDELCLFFENLREQIEIIQMFNNENELKTELFNTFLQRRFGVQQKIISEIWNNYNVENGLPLFKTLNVLIEKGIILNDKEKEIFEKGLNFYIDNNAKTLEEIADICDISRERTRQIRNSLLDEIKLTFSFVNHFELEAINLYGLDSDSDIVIISDELISEINIKENNRFNGLFINIILSILFEKSYKLIGNIESIAFNVAKARGINRPWKSVYLIKIELAQIFDFNSFYDDIDNRLSERIEEDYSFHFETYLNKFLKTDSYDKIYKIIPITEHILFNEFGIAINSFDNIIFKRKTAKQVFEYAREALESLGEPSKVSEICKKVIELNPDYETDESSIRASMQRARGFISFGRTSTYGLKDWEEEKDIRGGTIRDITEEYLISQSEPKHIDEITDYVNQYRDTNAKSIFANLKMEENNRFVFFTGMKIGLKSKVYNNDNLTNVKTLNIIRRTWTENFIELENFIKTNNRLPYSSTEESEAKLYRFYSLQLRKLKDCEDNTKFDMINNLVSPYLGNHRQKRNTRIFNHNISHKDQFISIQDSTKVEQSVPKIWWESLDRLKEYLRVNNQYPTASDERNLYLFCYQCCKKQKSNILHESQVQALKDINFTFTYESQKTWVELYEELKSFIEENKCWPRASRDSKTLEMRMYRFCNSILKSYDNNELTLEQLEKLKAISFPLVQGTTGNGWLDNYQKLKDFRLLNPNIWPRARGGQAEKPLYQFCYRNKNKFLEGTLEQYKIQLLKDINFDFYG